MKDAAHGVNLHTPETLAEMGQQRLADYLRALPADRQTLLLNQLQTLDLSVLRAASEPAEQRGRIEPVFATTLDEIAQNRERYTQRGLEAIRAGKVGAVMLAGGQGSRLGFDKPKGMFNIGVTGTLYIFECQIRNLKAVTEQAGAWVPLFIMTSEDNCEETQRFFAEHDYFGYSRDHIRFFRQEQLPVVDPDGQLLLNEDGMILTAPNGNGGWYASMERNEILNDIRSAGIEWLNVFAVDNVLQRIADPCFIGAVLDSGKESGAKVVAKAAPDEKVGVLCLEDGRPSIVEYFEMTDEMRSSREPDGSLSYNYGVILNYLFNTACLDQTLGVALPLHRACKKIRHMQPDGTVVVPEAPNAYKFETLALDLVRLQGSCLASEVERSKEFAPVKNKTGVDSADTARELLRKNGYTL